MPATRRLHQSFRFDFRADHVLKGRQDRCRRIDLARFKCQQLNAETKTIEFGLRECASIPGR